MFQEFNEAVQVSGLLEHRGVVHNVDSLLDKLSPSLSFIAVYPTVSKGVTPAPTSFLSGLDNFPNEMWYIDSGIIDT